MVAPFGGEAPNRVTAPRSHFLSSKSPLYIHISSFQAELPGRRSGGGGIPLQVKHRYSGLLVHSVEGPYAIKQLLNNAEYAKRLGENSREHVRQNFLLARHLQDYLLLFLTLHSHDDLVYP